MCNEDKSARVDYLLQDAAVSDFSFLIACFRLSIFGFFVFLAAYLVWFWLSLQLRRFIQFVIFVVYQNKKVAPIRSGLM